MPEESQSTNLLTDMPNPFLQDRVDSPWQEVFSDDPQINRTAFERCLTDIRAVQQGRQSWGLILHGEPGSGKTHLLHRLRLFTRKDPRTWFIYVPPFSSPNRFWRHLLERFFYDVCQRSKMPDDQVPGIQGGSHLEEGPGQGPLTQIEEALTRHLMGRPLCSTRELARLWADICTQSPPGSELFERLRKTFNQLTVQLKLDPDVMRVLRHYLTWHHRSVAYAYLLGRDLPDEDLGLLAVKQSLDDEDRAKEAVLTFCRLAGTAFTIILAFDQLEGLQLAVNDLDVLRTYSVHVGHLMGDECSNLLVLSAVQTYFLDTLKSAVHQSYYGRLAQSESVLTLLSRETARRLIQFRLGIQESLVKYRGENPGLGPLWPFSPQEIEEHVPDGGLSARELIRWARHRFEELRRGFETPLPPPDIGRHWEEHTESILAQPETRIDEGVYEDGLLKAFQARESKKYRVQRGKEKDLHLVLEGKGEKVGISISNTESMTSLARHLKRLQGLMDKKKVTRLVFVRDSRLPISPTARATRERLEDLTRRGMQTIRPPAEAYAALSVLRDMWNKAAENDLVLGDTTITMGQLKKWLAEETPRPLKDLMDGCQGEGGGLPEDLPDRLLEILTGRWIVPLKELAEEMAVTQEELSQQIVEYPDLARMIAGSPALVFLNPEAADRS